MELFLMAMKPVQYITVCNDKLLIISIKEKIKHIKL